MDILLRSKLWRDTDGQDFIEYSLMAGFVAVAAGAIIPNMAAKISAIFGRVTSLINSL